MTRVLLMVAGWLAAVVVQAGAQAGLSLVGVYTFPPVGGTPGELGLAAARLVPYALAGVVFGRISRSWRLSGVASLPLAYLLVWLDRQIDPEVSVSTVAFIAVGLAVNTVAAMVAGRRQKAA